MKEHIKSKQGAIDLAKQLEAQAPRYAALLNPMHSVWNDYDGSVRKHVQTLAYLRMEQVRPLLLAVTQRFTKNEVRKCLLALACWSVRFLITGVGSGTLEGHYGRNALEVWNEKIKNTAGLTNALISILPNDDAFQSSFSTARVSQARLARYYLRALQQKVDGEKEPHYVPNEGPEINLEHILPQSPGANWKHIDVETARAYTNRIGNLVLLQVTPNSQIGDSDFKTKKAVFQTSEYSLTKDVAVFPAWSAAEIGQRQLQLAQLAVQTWPLKPN